MSKKRLIPSIVLAICLLFGAIFGVALGAKPNKASAAPKTQYDFTNKISQQGDNNIYYAWGTPEHYVLMEYSVWGSGFSWIGPFEMYTQVTTWQNTSGRTFLVLHPGVLWSAMVVWVADRTGTISLEASFLRNKAVDGQEENGDGTEVLVHHRSGNSKTELYQYWCKTATETAMPTKNLNVNKGDRIIISVNSGPSRHQKNDKILGDVVIEYTATTGTDYVEGEDLSKFLDVTDAGAVAGYRDVSIAFEADDLAADETIDSDKTEVIIRGQSALNVLGADGVITGVEASLPIAIVAITCLGAALFVMYPSLAGKGMISGAISNKSQMRRMLVCILCLIMAATGLVFIGNGKTGYTETNTVQTETELEAAASGDNYQKYLNKPFNSTADRANVQGYNGWHYVCGKPGAIIEMAYNHNSGRWCSLYQQLYYYTYIWGDWYPDGQTGQGIGMTFEAPATGKMTITIKLKLKCDRTAGLNSNGVTLKTTSTDGRTTYTNLQYALNSSNTNKFNTEITLQDTNVKLVKGEEIVFLLYANNGNDTTYTSVDINVQYTGAYV
ncbi:MAG: hypothetical protein IJY57_04930 [Clostridia bacterium]|nr:hypothetical protein [Clostridia bacterium]